MNAPTTGQRLALEIPAELLQGRVSLFVGHNLDGTFTMSVLVRNPYRDRRKTISVRGYDLQTVVDTVAKQFSEAREACEIIL